MGEKIKPVFSALNVRVDSSETQNIKTPIPCASENPHLLVPLLLLHHLKTPDGKALVLARFSKG